jgi:urease accessory protein
MLLSRQALVPTALSGHARPPAGTGRFAFCRAGTKTVLATAFATSPLRFLAPRNHGSASWVFLSNLGGGLVDGDRLDVDVDAQQDSTVLLGTQASTKVYRSPHGCSQRYSLRVGAGAAVALIPDPVVCFEGARYSQSVTVELEAGASIVVLDAYTCGRAARGEHWRFARLESRIQIDLRGRPRLVDATTLDHAHGDIAQRMGRFLALATLVAIGPRFAPVQRAILAANDGATTDTRAICAPSSAGHDGAILRVGAESFECASRKLRSSFAALAEVLGDDPFARKW